MEACGTLLLAIIAKYILECNAEIRVLKKGTAWAMDCFYHMWYNYNFHVNVMTNA